MAEAEATAGASPVIEVRGLSYSFGERVALRDVSFTAGAGELLAVIGPNGAGKTTLLSILAGIRKPDAGTVRTPAGAVGWVPQQAALYRRLTVEENLRLGAAVRKDRAEIQRDMERWCAFFPILGERLRRPAGTLSGGQQQMLAIARALMARPALMMLDEPSLGLSPKLVDDVFALIGELRDLGTTILLVEQNVEKTLALVDRAYLLNAGRVEFAGPPRTLREHADIESAYLGRHNGPGPEAGPG